MPSRKAVVVRTKIGTSAIMRDTVDDNQGEGVEFVKVLGEIWIVAQRVFPGKTVGQFQLRKTAATRPPKHTKSWPSSMCGGSESYQQSFNIKINGAHYR
jgi:hypothetical protein